MKKTIAIIGYGALSRIFLDIFEKQLAEQYALNGIHTRRPPEAAGAFQFSTIYPDYFGISPIASWSLQARRQSGSLEKPFLNNGSSLIIVSIGALTADGLYQTLSQAAAPKHVWRSPPVQLPPIPNPARLQPGAWLRCSKTSPALFSYSENEVLPARFALRRRFPGWQPFFKQTARPGYAGSPGLVILWSIAHTYR